MMHGLLVFSIVFLAITVMICSYRAIKGPKATDRLIAINVIGTKTVVLICILSFILKETYFIDVVLVYALISFVSTLVIARHIESRGSKT
jgi:multicomponent Na+:H+ antiporter subunit F